VVNPECREWVSRFTNAAQIPPMETLFQPEEAIARGIITDWQKSSINARQLSAAKRTLIAQSRNGHRPVAPPARIPSSAAVEPAPLSSNQEQSWFFSQLQPRSPLYNVPVAIRLSGRLEIPALQKAIEQIVARHEVLRTRFAGEFQPEQVVAEIATVPVIVTDLRGISADMREVVLERRVQEEIRQPFDLARDLMIRVHVFRMEEDDWALTVVLHHIASDFWSWRVLCRELTPLYEGILNRKRSVLPKLPIQYRDFGRWQQEWLRGADCENHLGYWRQNLAGAPALLELPFSRPRPAAQSFDGAVEYMALPKKLHGQLMDLSRSGEVTLFMTLLAAFVALLSRYTNREDMVVGSPAAGRCRAELENLIGFFANIMVLRASLKGDPTFRELLHRTREVVLDALAHQEVPFAKLVQQLRPPRSASHLPFFQIVFMLQDEMAGSFHIPGITARDMEIDAGIAKFDLMLTVLEGEQGLRCCAEYNTALFGNADIRRMLTEYQRFLETVVTQPDVKISRFK
jgi:hypothetical protein